ncbi:hypothetical protein PV05_04913 [Exophiala xenobiotica]|uniref:Uncharacterized protein n=1 Tax=Exophiala xenobiotica TaxID=348802 RepID=A0A0D2ELC1_9EURO|nr:uncharacterized protein PV05_04913 [Exophiala xenobiotica]KIW56238.1 hypothetical protein PV05_04913 [Exophiala xenobiotica]
MASLKGTNTSIIVFFLMSFALFNSVFALVQIHQGCSYDVWCAVVEGYGPDSTVPPSERPPPNWIKQAQGSMLVDKFLSHPKDIGVAIMCTRNKDASPIEVTQVEYTWEPKNGKTWFDVSNVAGDPFVAEGFGMVVDDPVKPLFDTCKGAYCGPGDQNCADVYMKWNDDFQGMRTCSDAVTITLVLCSG